MNKSWKKGWAAVAGFTVLIAATSLEAKSRPTSPKKANEAGELVVHEWGTFLSVQGSDGATLGGMVDSEEVLPPFVESRNIETWQRSMMFCKMETPVTYFYTDRPRQVHVRVEMSKGILTHWFPAVLRYGPDASADPSAKAAWSFLCWPEIQLIPANRPIAQDKNKPALALKKIAPEQTWHFARETDAAFVKVSTFNSKGEPAQDQMEKFLFYRGLGTFELPLQVRSFAGRRTNNPLLELHNGDEAPLRGLFVISVEHNTIRFAAVGDLAGKASQPLAVNTILPSPQPLEVGVPEVKSAVAASLVSAGLFVKEADAMVNTWEKSYFRTEGLRLLYVLPRKKVDQIIPIQIKPVPDQLERVMVGRVEILTPERERQIEQFVSELGAKEFRIRQAASAGLAGLGRIGEPALRRVMTTTTDAEVRARAVSLIRKMANGS